MFLKTDLSSVSSWMKRAIAHLRAAIDEPIPTSFGSFAFRRHKAPIPVPGIGMNPAYLLHDIVRAAVAETQATGLLMRPNSCNRFHLLATSSMNKTNRKL